MVREDLMPVKTPAFHSKVVKKQAILQKVVK
jgi:hypothetical protein